MRDRGMVSGLVAECHCLEWAPSALWFGSNRYKGTKVLLFEIQPTDHGGQFP